VCTFPTSPMANATKLRTLRRTARLLFKATRETEWSAPHGDTDAAEGSHGRVLSNRRSVRVNEAAAKGAGQPCLPRTADDQTQQRLAPSPDDAPRSHCHSKEYGPLMKWFIGLGMLVWPSWASVSGAPRWIDAAGAAVAILVIGLIFGSKFPQDVAPLTLAGIAGGVVGVLIGLFYGIVRGYWVGAGMSVGFIVASATVVAFCRTRTDQGLIRGL
jgi:hypothetical protein